MNRQLPVAGPAEVRAAAIRDLGAERRTVIGLALINGLASAAGLIGPWLLGRDISLADVSVMPVIVRLADLRQESLWQDKPAIARWLDNIRAHPAYAKTYYHGTHLTELYPHLQERAPA